MLRQRQRLSLLLPLGLDRLHLRRRAALHRFGRQRLSLHDQRLTIRLRSIAHRRQRIAQRREHSLEPRVELFPCARFDAAQIAFSPRVIGVAQPALDRAPVARLNEQARRVRGCRGDEFVAPLTRLLSLRRQLREMFGGRCIGFFARAVEAFP